MHTRAVSLRVRMTIAIGTAVAALGLVAVLSQPAEAKVKKGPAGLAFYNPPKNLPKQHGTLIWARGATGVAPLADARYTKLVLYSSRTPQGTRDAISGTVAVPRGRPPKGGWPVITFAHGTTGAADSCAPSRDAVGGPLNGGTTYINPDLNEWLRHGYAVVRTDYQGLGTPGPHPYLIGESEGRSTLDIVQAARELDKHVGKRFLIAGHSQGGHAALFAAGEAAGWVPQLRLRGTVAFAPASHVLEQTSLLSNLTSPSGFTALATLVLYGAATQSAQINPAQLLSDQVLQFYPLLEQQCIGQLGSSNQLGGIGKDVWVLASEPERQVSLLAATNRPLEVTREGGDVPGRVADDLFWLGRYAERTEALARLLREVLLRLFATDRALPGSALELLLRAVTRQTDTWPGFVGEGAEARLAAPETELLPLILDPRRIGGLRFNVDCVARTGRAVRDRLSTDAARVIGAIDRELARPSDLASALEAIERLVLLLAGFVGLSAESMTRSQGWRFLELGRFLERALQTIRLRRGVLLPATGAVVTPASEALLAIAQSLRTYRRRYRSQVQWAAVLDLLLLDESSPRSLAYQFVRIEALIGELTSGAADPQRSAAERLALEGLTLVRLFDVRGSSRGGSTAEAMAADASAFEAFLDRMTALLGALADEIQRRWFEPAELPQQLVRLA